MLIKLGEPVGVAEFPVVREPGVEIALRPGGEVHQQLREVELRIDVVPAAGGSQAGEDGGGTAAARVTNEERVFAIEYDALHLAFRNVVVDGDGAIGAEDGEFGPLAQGVVDGFGHGMLGQQLLLPTQQLLLQFG